MGFSLIKYPAIDAKLKGMYAKQLSNTDLLELIRQPDSISVISSLKTKFKPLEFLKDDATRVETEDALDSVLIEDIKKIRIYLSDKTCRFVSDWCVLMDFDLRGNTAMCFFRSFFISQEIASYETKKLRKDAHSAQWNEEAYPLFCIAYFVCAFMLVAMIEKNKKI